MNTTRRPYVLTSFVFLRGLGLVYSAAFLALVNQAEPLLGSRGLLPAARFLGDVQNAAGSSLAAAARLPTLFWVSASDRALGLGALVGLALSLLVLAGWANALVLGALWALYLSYVHIGQVFFGYGWDILLCETGFLAIFLAPGYRLRPWGSAFAPPVVVLVLLRWLLFRLMFGAGLIKVRGDACWTDLTCLLHHYETQPNPSPLSYWFHQLPAWMHRGGVLFNHAVELVVPFGVFGPRPVRIGAGSAIVIFQVLLILSGNLSFLNWLTLVIAIACFDDELIARCFPVALGRRLADSAAEAPRPRRLVTYAVAVLIGILSLNPIVNLLSTRQRMNASFDPFGLVNTYGAFGSVSRERYEVEIEGTNDAVPAQSTAWEAYVFPCKPGPLERRPCLVTPYHYRLDWQMWFLQFSPEQVPPWFVHLIVKLQENDAVALSLVSENPFREKAPVWLRAAMYRYAFSREGTSMWWSREYVGDLVRPVSRDDVTLRDYLERQGLR